MDQAIPRRRFSLRHQKKEEVVQEQSSPPEEIQMDEQEPQVRYAGFWMRFWAFLLDLVVIFSINAIVVYPTFRWFGLNIQLSVWSLEVILASLIGYAYYVIMTKEYGQTVGKMVFGLKVVNQQGGPLSWGEVLFREVVGRFLHQVFALFILLYLVVAFTRKKQGIHDMIADTYVVHEES
ncbi:RDD family protein [Halalkalibacterium halodurans]|jgi:uncharacterized RDD family membrane protein YckC|uniref:RDD family protein n=1 Tax=Halalkalibacterium halodurans TaxID=86665 RepID=UPI001067A1D2|nr:RDD family protein [Halalkalibacterium halodurans]MED3647202.1 RDD family protein [Halalkalibacterium halodurans]TES58251.1 RDD family protein [Halalkalibacterium halodurans]